MSVLSPHEVNSLTRQTQNCTTLMWSGHLVTEGYSFLAANRSTNARF